MADMPQDQSAFDTTMTRLTIVCVIGVAAYARLSKEWGDTKREASLDHELIAFLQSELFKAGTKDSELSETLQGAMTANADLSVQLRAANSQVMDTQTDRDAAEQACASAIIELYITRRENDGLHRHKHELYQKVDDKTQEVIDFSRLMDDMAAERKVLNTQRDRILKSLRNLRQDKVELSSQNSSLSRGNMKLVLETQQHLATLEIQEEEWKYERCTIAALVVEVQAQKATLQHSLDAANERHLQEQDRSHTQLRIRIEKEEIHSLKQQLSEQAKSQQALSDEKEAVLAEHEKKSKQINQTEDEAKSRQAGMQTIIDNLQGQMENIEEQEKMLRVNSENEIKDSNNELEKIEAEYSQKTAASHSRSYQMRQELDRRTNTANLQAGAINEKDREIRELEETVKKLRAGHENEIADLRREIQTLKEETDDVHVHREKAKFEATEDNVCAEVDTTDQPTEKTIDGMAEKSAEATVQKPSSEIAEPKSEYGLIVDQLKDVSLDIPSPEVSQEFLDFLQETLSNVTPGKGIIREWLKKFICSSVVKRGPYAQDQVLELQLPCHDPLYNKFGVPMPTKSTDPALKCSECNFCHQRYAYTDRQDHLKMCLTFFNGFAVYCAGCKKVFINNDAFRAVHQPQCPNSVVLLRKPPISEDSVLECSLAGVDWPYDVSAINTLKDAKLGSIRDTQLVPSKRPHEDQNFTFFWAYKRLPKPRDPPKLLAKSSGDTCNNKNHCRLCKEWYLYAEELSTHLPVYQQFFNGREGFVPHVLCENCNVVFCRNEYSAVHVRECGTVQKQRVYCEQVQDIEDGQDISHSGIFPDNAQNNPQSKKAGKRPQATRPQTQAAVPSNGIDTQQSVHFAPSSNTESASFQPTEFTSFQPLQAPLTNLSPSASPFTPSSLSGPSLSSAQDQALQDQQLQDPVDNSAQPPNPSTMPRQITPVGVDPIRDSRPDRKEENYEQVPTKSYTPPARYSSVSLDRSRRLPYA